MAGFDIETLANFEAPLARCPHCLGLWTVTTPDCSSSSFRCPVCDTFFSCPFKTPSPFAEYAYGPPQPGHTIDLGADPLQHAAELGRTARDLRLHDESLTPLRALMILLRTARSFVHVTTLNLDEFMLAVLEMTAQTVHVAVLISGLSKNMLDEVEHAHQEAPGLDLRVESVQGDKGVYRHSKLIVVDGLVAVSGSANMNNKAWRKAPSGRELITVDTDTEKVRGLNDRHFAAIWSELTPEKDRGQLRVVGEWTVVDPYSEGHPLRALERQRQAEPFRSAGGATWRGSRQTGELGEKSWFGPGMLGLGPEDVRVFPEDDPLFQRNSMRHDLADCSTGSTLAIGTLCNPLLGHQAKTHSPSVRSTSPTSPVSMIRSNTGAAVWRTRSPLASAIYLACPNTSTRSGMPVVAHPGIPGRIWSASLSRPGSLRRRDDRSVRRRGPPPSPGTTRMAGQAAETSLEAVT